jgi:hypothetical protein
MNVLYLFSLGDADFFPNNIIYECFILFSLGDANFFVIVLLFCVALIVAVVVAIVVGRVRAAHFVRLRFGPKCGMQMTLISHSERIN